MYNARKHDFQNLPNGEHSLYYLDVIMTEKPTYEELEKVGMHLTQP